MQQNPSTVGIAPGAGLIARFGGVVVYLAGETPSTDRILGAIEAVADARHPGAAIAQRLAAVVFGGNSEPPPFGVVAPTADGTVILLRGQVTAEIQGAEGTRRLSGARAFTWVDEIVREPVRRITVGADSAFPVHELPRTDLRAGIVPGGGFTLRIAARRAGKSAAAGGRSTGPSPSLGTTPEPPPTAAAGLEALLDPTAQSQHTSKSRRTDAAQPPTAAGPRQQPSVRSATPDEPTEKAGSTGIPRQSSAQSEDPTEKAGPGAAAQSPVAERTTSSAKGRAPESGESGATQAPQDVSTQAMSAAERADPGGSRAGTPSRPEPIALHKIPPLHGVRPRPVRPVGGVGNPESSGQVAGALILEDGAAYPLDRTYVVGRSPTVDEAVRAATATPITVPRDRHVSRVHAYVSVDRGKVYVRDAATPAGTFIAAPGDDDWTRVGTAPIELPPGWSLRIGQRIITYRTEDRPKHPTEAGKDRRS
ncbi:FHA domain-containing protein [Nocardia sp. CA-107356]|uniref:FHA domain-containing protein n=1 Tax=Nocardia sp. CA-107356 TaxID=3239972 RepID=UPI003D8BF0F9